MLEPKEINEEEAQRFGVPAGWWGVDEAGTPVVGPHPSREGALVGIAKSGRRDPDETETAKPSKDQSQARKDQSQA